MQNQPGKLVYLRDWVGQNVSVLTSGGASMTGKLTNIAFDEKRLMYVVIEDREIINFDHVVSIKLAR